MQHDDIIELQRKKES